MMVLKKMHYFWAFLGLFLFSYSLSYALCDFQVEGRVACYLPASKKVRHIYGDAWANYQIAVLKNITPQWQLWSGASFLPKKGHSYGCCHSPTRLRLIPINFGAKYFIPVCGNIKGYIGGAICYSILRIKDDAYDVHRHTRKRAWGGLTQVGLTYDLWERGALDLFIDYYFQQFHFKTKNDTRRYVKRSSLNMNGLQVGLGLGLKF
ncbi:MAG: hypothetical protein ACSNEK_09785 [Parachlamydiaceae bacterium]